MFAARRAKRADARNVNRVKSLWDDEVAPNALTIATVTGLWLVVAFSFERAFSDGEQHRHLIATLPGLMAGTAWAATVGRKRLGLAFIATLATGLLSLPIFFLRVFPTPSSIVDGIAIVSSGVDSMLHDIAPVQVTSGFLSLLWVAGLILGFLAASWVVVGRPIGAILTGLVIIGYSGQVGTGAGRVGYGVAAATATLAYFLSESRQRMEQWGGAKQKLASGFGVPSLLVASLFAALAGSATADIKPIIELQGEGGGRLVIIKPLSDIRRQLDIEPPIEVMKVRADLSTYWRLTSLDRYTGEEWLLETETIPGNFRSIIDPPTPPNAGQELHQEFSITSLLAPWVPGAFAIREVFLPEELEFDSDPKSSTVLISGNALPGLEYRVTSILSDRTNQRDVRVNSHKPDDIERNFGEVARNITGASDPLAQGLALETHFRQYVYDDKVPAGHTVERLNQFLVDRRGYCEQFAAVMTLMMRGLGIDTRVGVGFLPGGLLGGQHIVSTDEAHAWVEAKIPGRGWVIFDPTPGRGDAASEDPSLAPPPEITPEPTGGGATPTPTPVPPQGSDSPNPTSPDSKPALWIPFALLWPAAIPAMKRVRQQKRRKLSGVAGVIAAFQELVDRARDLGLSLQANETTTEYLQRIAPDQRAIGAATNEAIFSANPNVNADTAWAAATTAVAHIRSNKNLFQRIVAAFNPRTLFP